MAEDLDLAPAAESGGADAEISRAGASLERAAERSGLGSAPESDRGSEAAPAAERTPAAPSAPTPPAWDERWREGNRTWNEANRHRLSRAERREEGRRLAEERRVQEGARRLLEEKIDSLHAAVTAKPGEEPDFDLNGKEWWEKQFKELRESVEAQLAPLKETLAERQERIEQEAKQREEAEQFGEWAEERAEWVGAAEAAWVGGDRQRANEYGFYKDVVAATVYDQGKLIFGESPQAQAFARSAMLSMTDMAARYNLNPAALIEGMGRQQMMTALRMAKGLGLIEMVKENGAPKAPAASVVVDQREFIQSAEAGGAAPPPAARTNGKSPRDGDFTKWVVNTLAEKGGTRGMPEIHRRGREKYGPDWPRVYAELQQTIRRVARG